MSIPKEPRQLMINLMYLVLTALLALNVSAEVMNAFFDLDKSLTKSNTLTNQSTLDTKEGIQATLDKKPNIKEPLNGGIDATLEEVNDFVSYIESIKSRLIDETGNKNGEVDEGDYDKHHKPKGKKNKDFTTRMLVKEEKVGDQIEEKVGLVREKLVEIYAATIKNEAIVKEAKLNDEEIAKKIESLKNNITLKVEDDWKEKSPDKTSWADYKFRQMPVAAVLPALTKLQADARNAQATIVNKLAELVGGRELKLNKFFPVMNAKKGYVIKGEKFEAEVSIGAYSSEFSKTSSITVGGKKIKLNDEGKGTFSERASSYGKRKLKLVANVTNPLTNEKFSGSSEFEYEVGERSATVSATKMNVFYIGVDNPLEASVAGASSNELKVTGSGVKVSGRNGKYNVTAKKPGPVKITVKAGSLTKSFDFRVKRIPDPAPVLGAGPNKKGGVVGNGEFKAQLGLAAILEGFDFDAKCNIQGYELTRVAKRQDPVSATNRGGRYSSDAKRLVGQAKPGDTYYFDNVKAKCPGDAAGRRLPSIVFKIK